jgi:hypothetical protein
MLEFVGSPESVSSRPAWQKRLTYVTTTRQNTSGRFPSVGTVISAEKLVGAKLDCPRCGAPSATLWRRFDYFGQDLPIYFTKCGRCRRRSLIEADEAAFRLVEAEVLDPMNLLHEGIPAASEGRETHGREDHPSSGGEEVSVTAAEALVANRQRAFGKKHPLTFAARAQLVEAVGKSGDAPEAARMFEQLVADQLAAVGHQSPAVLANRYSAAVWKAQAGDPAQALAALRGLLADEEAILGTDHANTLITRATIAQLIDETGDRDEAIEMLRQVSKDQLRVLGSEHPATEASRQLLADWEGR